MKKSKKIEKTRLLGDNLYKDLLLVRSCFDEIKIFSSFAVETLSQGVDLEIKTKRKLIEKKKEHQKILNDVDSNPVIVPYSRYEKDHSSMEEFQDYSFRLIDGALIHCLYTIKEGKVVKSKMSFRQSPFLKPYDTYFKDYIFYVNNGYLEEHLDSLSVFNSLESNLVELRFDYDPCPKSFKPKYHPASHFTLGNYRNCRVPVSHWISPVEFAKFIIKNFYSVAYKKSEKFFEVNLGKISIKQGELTLHDEEKSLLYLDIS